MALFSKKEKETGKTGYFCCYCFSSYTEPHYLCRNRDCVSRGEKDEERSRFQGIAADAEYHAVRRNRCDRCKSTDLIRVCPVCHNPEPAGKASGIAVIGSSGSGKSSLISAAVSEFISSGWDFADGYSESLFEKGYRIRNNKALDRTPSVSGNRILHFTSDDRFVSIIDIPGEDLESSGNREKSAPEKYIAKASGILFAVDLSKTDSALNILNYLVSLEGIKEIPVAVVLMKSDRISAGLPRSSALFIPEEAAEGEEYEEDSEMINSEVSERIGRSIQGFIKTVNGFDRCRFFAASALGNDPDKGGVVYLAPVRAKDPFIWLLREKECNGQ